MYTAMSYSSPVYSIIIALEATQNQMSTAAATDLANRNAPYSPLRDTRRKQYNAHCVALADIATASVDVRTIRGQHRSLSSSMH